MKIRSNGKIRAAHGVALGVLGACWLRQSRTANKGGDRAKGMQNGFY